MTVSIAWVRKIRNCEEIVFASDSRLSGDGRSFDSAPKILTLPRTDCAIAFSGYTGDAFPMMLQLALAVDSYAPARRGSLYLSSLLKHALKVFDTMAELIRSSEGISTAQDTAPSANFLFGGYSWENKRFRLWSIVFSPSEQRFQAHPAKWCYFSKPAKKFVISSKKLLQPPAGAIAFTGDQATKARALLLAKLDEKHPGGGTYSGLDWEPFEAIRDMLREQGRSETIGGAPQIVKVYQYMRSAPLGVYWPNKATGKVFLFGRPCLGYENIDRWVLDPDTLESHSPTYSRDDVDDEEQDVASGDPV